MRVYNHLCVEPPSFPVLHYIHYITLHYITLHYITLLPTKMLHLGVYYLLYAHLKSLNLAVYHVDVYSYIPSPLHALIVKRDNPTIGIEIRPPTTAETTCRLSSTGWIKAKQICLTWQESGRVGLLCGN